MTRFFPSHAMIAGAVMVLAPAVVQAQAASPQSTAAATALVDLITPPAQGKAGLDAQIKAIREGQMIRGMLGNNPAFRAEAAKNQPAFNAGIARIGAMQAQALGPIFTEMQAASRKAAISEYSKRFTPAELNAIMAFYRSPAGAKLMKQQPQVAQAINRQVQATYAPRMETAQKNLGPKIEAELKKLFPQQAGKG